jgi:hypothetical protein
MLAFNFSSRDDANNLAGFTIFCPPPGEVPGYYLQNDLRFENPGKHTQVARESPNSTANAPIQKYRWTHYPGTAHQGIPEFGDYTYTVTPRHFDSNSSMQALDSGLSVSVKVPVGPFKSGYARIYARLRAVGSLRASLRPAHAGRAQDQATGFRHQHAGRHGQPVTFAQIYNWMGETARDQVFAVLDRVLNDSSLTLKVFAYDLNEPDIVKILLTLAEQGRVRIILDNTSLHVTKKAAKVKTPEDQFTDLFQQPKKDPSSIVRRSFGRSSRTTRSLSSRGAEEAPSRSSPAPQTFL